MPRTSKIPKSSNTAVVSASRRVYLALRQRIIDMVMPPGMRIVELDIAAEHGVSRTPVHEAVQRLAEEGLIEIVQRVGTFVARIPINELVEAMFIRTSLEVTVVELATAKATPADVTRLRGILDVQRTCAQASDANNFHLADEAFHAALAEIAGCPGVWRIIQQTKTQVDRFRRLTLPIEGRMKGVIEEHGHIVDEVASGKASKATAAMREHLDHVLPAIEITRAFRPDFFVNHSAPVEHRP